MIKGSTGRTIGLAAALTLALVACGDDPLGPDPEDVEFAASLGIDLDDMTEAANGLFFKDDVVGTGEIAAAGDSATVSYVLWLADGTSPDSGVFPFILGAGESIQGFDQGVTGMRVGGVRTVVIPASLAYGSIQFGAIPPDAVLVYELSLTAVVKPPF